jgi:putative ABC transport system permease protein
LKTIDVQNQPILSLARTVKITVNGIRYRLFRSAVTVVVVAVAMAFLTNILSESLIRRSVAQRTQRRIGELREAAIWAGTLSDPGTPRDLITRVAAGGRDGGACREAVAMGGLAEEQMDAYYAAAVQAAAYLDFFDEIDYARRRALVHNARGLAVFEQLGTDEGMERFTTALSRMRSVELPTSMEALREFVARWPDVAAQTGAIHEGRAKAVAAVKAALGGRRALDALCDADGAFGETVRSAGFALDREEAPNVAKLARQMVQALLLERSIGEPEMRKAVAGRLDLLPVDVTVVTMWRVVRSRRGAEWYLAEQERLGGPAVGLEADEVVALARLEAEKRQLGRLELLGSPSGGPFGIGERMGWLILASMLVCTVGIANAMLMSVTERFREIATLKCLGALDGFIMLMFVLEAAFLGIAGGVAGAVAGSVIGLGRMLLPYGSLVIASLPVLELLAAMAAAVVLGVILAALASVYPSFKAARLAPMEAMRIQ